MGSRAPWSIPGHLYRPRRAASGRDGETPVAHQDRGPASEHDCAAVHDSRSRRARGAARDAKRDAASLGVTSPAYRATTPEELHGALAPIVGIAWTRCSTSRVACRYSIASRCRLRRRASPASIYQATMFADAGGLMTWAPDLVDSTRIGEIGGKDTQGCQARRPADHLSHRLLPDHQCRRGQEVASPCRRRCSRKRRG